MGGRHNHGSSKDAISMLDRCHVRLLENIELLVNAAIRWERSGDRDAIEDARSVCEFLTRTASRHERDEEDSIFPRLESSERVDEVIRVLTAEHRDHQREITALRDVLAASGKPDAEALSICASRLSSAYQAHVALEDAELTPRLKALSPATLEAILAEMQTRRGR